MKNEFCSIVLLQYRHGSRESIAKLCLTTLIQNTTYPYELILVDNTQNNRGLSVGRNFGISLTTGEYICIVDDDILLSPLWLEECISMVNLGDKFMATPVWQHHIHNWEMEPVEGYRQNYRTGSNCMVMRRSAFDDIGNFIDFTKRSIPYDNAKNGKEFANRVARKGYTFLITRKPLAEDLGYRVHSYLET